MKKKLLGVSLITLTCLYGLLAGVVILAFYFTKIPIIYGIYLSIIILIFQFLVSPFLTDLTMRWLYGTEFNYKLPAYLEDFILKICEKYNMKHPKIGFINDGTPNVFTYGRTKNDSRIIISKGIFDLLNEEEAKATIGHELGHAIHYDTLVITAAQLVPLVLYGIYEIFIKQNDNSSKNSYAASIALLAYILYFVCQYIILWLSRTREYYADDFSINETKNPNALAEALVKIGYGLSTKSSAQEKTIHSIRKSNVLGIFDSKTSKSLVVSSFENNTVDKENIKNAMKWEMWNLWAKIYELNSTHPLISKRLKHVSTRSIEFNQEPYINFNLVKSESYIDDFVIDIFINILPLLMFFITIILMMLLPNINMFIFGLGGIITILFSFYKLSVTHGNKKYPKTNVNNLLGEVKVSGITSIPCELKGRIIGRGNPGCILNEDFVIEDETGIMLLDYNQPLNIINKLFAIFNSKEYFDKIVTIKGWYRRCPVPFVEIYTMEIDGKIKKCHTYTFSKIIRFILLILFIIVFINSIIKL